MAGHLGAFELGFDSWCRILDNSVTDDIRVKNFEQFAREVVTYVGKGLDRTVACDELIDRAEPYGFDPNWVESVLNHAFEPRPQQTNGKDHAEYRGPDAEAEIIPPPEQAPPQGEPMPRIVPVAEFIKGFKPPDYLIDGILQRRFIYSLTGQTGHAKTALALLLAQLVGSTDPNPIFGLHRVEQGRVIYFVGENPDDVRMRLIGINARRDPADDRISLIPGVCNIPSFFKTLESDAKKNGDVSLVIIDTSAAYFLGNDEIDNVGMGKHARMLRTLTTLPGGPCVLTLCHPIKHASDPSQLLPRGGGAFMAEMDGNLGLWRLDDELVTLDHCGKFRGPGFQPITFRLVSIRDAPGLVDSKGRQLSTVHAVAITDQEEDAQRSKTLDDDDHIIAAYLKTPEASIADVANACGWMYGSGNPDKSRVQRAIGRLEHAKPVLILKDRNRWVLTEKGKEAARKVALRLLNQAASAAQSRMFDQ